MTDTKAKQVVVKATELEQISELMAKAEFGSKEHIRLNAAFFEALTAERVAKRT